MMPQMIKTVLDRSILRQLFIFSVSWLAQQFKDVDGHLINRYPVGPKITFDSVHAFKMNAGI